MEPLKVARGYFEAWNHRDPAAIVATFASGGTYRDPLVPEGLTGPAIAGYAGGLFGAFPDLSFEIVSAAPTGPATVAAQWLMRGTNSGPLQGNPPTGRRLALPGADFIAVDGDRIRSVQGYFDQKTFVEQLGLQAIVVPTAVGPMMFGSSARMASGSRTKPGAISLTWIDPRSDAEEREIRDRSIQIALTQMPKIPGFLGWVGSVVGRRMFTTTAWDDVGAAAQLLVGGPHKDAVTRAFEGDLGAAFFTSVWVPHHLNAMWMRCAACGKVSDVDHSNGRCRCGEVLPEHPPYW